jgi:hypothetical protein
LTSRRLDRLPFRITPIVVVAAACGSGQTAPPAADHTPVSYTVLINGNQVTAPYTFTAGQTVRVRLKFLNAASEDLDDIETEHFAGLTFNSAALGTITRVADHHYQFDVAGGTPGAGTMRVSFGHDEQADETTFPAADVTVSSASVPK